MGQLHPHKASSRSAFTLIELLVTIAIISVLIGVLLPALGMAVSHARGFKCQMSQRSVAFDFQLFADDVLHGDRGDDGDSNTFKIETFQESQYGVDEFWRWDSLGTYETPDTDGNDPMRCPSVREPLVLRSNLACSSGAAGPASSISYAFNARLDRAEIVDQHGRPRLRAVSLNSTILQQSKVPLLIDADGTRAAELGVNALYTAPSLDSLGPYADDRVWFPGLRHAGKANTAFMDGHVASSSTPAQESSWNWEYQPIAR